MNLLVAGGGIGGLTLAVALEQRGIDYVVFEDIQYPRTAFLQGQSLALGRVVQLERGWALTLRRTVARCAPRWLDRIPVTQIFRYDADAA